MTRRAFLASAAASAALAQAPPKRPNILFLMTDQQRYDSLGVNGNKLVRTPRLDAFAGEAANFSHCFVQAPVCVPSRITWFTGRYPHSHKNRVNYTPLDPGETLMQRWLQQAGYRTASIGKLHYWPPTPEHARSTGFDHVEIHDGVNALDHHSDYVRWRAERDPHARDYHYRALDPDPNGNPYRGRLPAEFHETTWVGERTRAQIAEAGRDGRPWFVFASFFQPHSPFVAPRPWDAMFNDVDFPLPRPYSLEEIERLPEPLQQLILRGRPQYDMDREQLQWAFRTYHANCAMLDAEIGRTLDALEASGQADNTIVVVSTDHGDQLLEHGLMGKNCFFEGSIRLPFLIRYPGRIRPGRRDELIETTDLLPTLFELAGVEEPYNCQGRSFAPLLTGSGSYQTRDAVFSENVIPEVITSGSLDFEFEKGKGIKGVRHPDAKMVRTHRWKLVQYAGGEGELYDLEGDPNEQQNLYKESAHAKTVAQLQQRLLLWLMRADETDQIAPRWQRDEP
ncbi:MAG: sulfatase-like hydrolase/transferase [Acidobacteria bacterium]|nr:sulfatase-like hydrolase/transferase [Acidobacteriota bacterium]